jgi:hypothetical protein
MKVFDWNVPLKVEGVKVKGMLSWVSWGQLEQADALIAVGVAKQAGRQRPGPQRRHPRRIRDRHRARFHDPQGRAGALRRGRRRAQL